MVEGLTSSCLAMLSNDAPPAIRWAARDARGLSLLAERCIVVHLRSRKVYRIRRPASATSDKKCSLSAMAQVLETKDDTGPSRLVSFCPPSTELREHACFVPLAERKIVLRFLVFYLSIGTSRGVRHGP